jgi:hypothetical protein
MRQLQLIAAGLFFTIVGAQSARADQCAVVNKDQSTWALKHIKASGKVILWCEKCGVDNSKSAPTKVGTVKTVPFKGGSPGDVEISINGKNQDLAYTYVQTGARTWANLAFLVGCPANDVKQFTDGEPIANTAKPMTGPPAGKPGMPAPAGSPPPPPAKQQPMLPKRVIKD